ncbi:MAG TPA: radical SAM family heme chaperone HemW [Candidatus Aquilonibacter sp.]|nr:radical SAM family heme chaperone HemW [Candidatus Aquilonibacter sp.]
MGVVPQAERLGLYVSVPFCRAKCSFCNFASGVSSAERVAEYVRRLCAEIDGVEERVSALGAQLPRRVDTVYFGGGTPSLLEPTQLGQIFSALRRQFDLDPEAELTLEAAPGQIPDELLNEAMALGVNRASLGIQSFIDRESSAVGRTHTGESCVAEMERLRRRGLENVGADLIAGLPYQTHESWKVSLKAACESGLAHVSVYLLEIDEGSRLGREILGGGARLHAPAVASEELAAELYEQACDFLPQYGLEQYEISNFARAGRQSRHNRKYWTRAPYLGFGLDAHSMLLRTDGGAVRFANPDQLEDYETAAAVEVTDITKRDAFEESIFLGLRLNEGVAVSALREQHPTAWVNECAERVAMLTREGMMSADADRWKLTRRGRLVSSEVFGELLAGVGA